MQEQTLSLDCSEEGSPVHLPMQKPAGFVRASLQKLSEMTDSALQEYINYCAESMMAAHQRWKVTGSFADVGERDACWLAEADALIERGNRPQLVLKMERERNLA